MFGISFFELLLIMVVAVVFIKPEDVPTVAKTIAKAFIKIKKFIASIKQELDEMSKDLGLDEIKKQAEQEIAFEESQKKSAQQNLPKKSADNSTVIIDIYGNEHRVENLEELRPDLDQEQLQGEIKKQNEINLSQSTSSKL